MKKFYVYVYLNPLKPGNYCFDNLNFEFEPFYVGKGASNRIDEHCFDSHLKKDTNKSKVNTILKILKHGNNVIKIKMYDNLTEKESFEKESYLISKIGRKDLKLGTLTNLTNGGEGSSGRMLSDESKEKISKSVSNLSLWKGEKNPSKSNEHKTFMSNLLKGRVFSEEAKDKMRKSKLGKKLSEDHRKNIIKSLIGRVSSDEKKRKISEANSNKIRSCETKCFLSLRRIEKTKIREYVNSIIFIKKNIFKDTNFLMKHSNMSRSVINKIKKNKNHWVFNFNDDEIKRIGENFIKMQPEQDYKTIF
jgi:hypothetical protein